MLAVQAALFSAVIAGPEGGQAGSLAPALALYEHAIEEGRRGWSWSGLRRRAGALGSLALTAAEAATLDRRDAGLQAVAIERIRGSENRTLDFDAGFHPLNERTRERWLSIARARLRGATMPPVELIRVGEAYFVRDGHHRISVARALGEEFVDAHVAVWTSGVQRVPEPARLGIFAAFRARVRLEAAPWRLRVTGD
jgi:hypothetical protein